MKKEPYRTDVSKIVNSMSRNDRERFEESVELQRNLGIISQDLDRAYDISKKLILRENGPKKSLESQSFKMPNFSSLKKIAKHLAYGTIGFLAIGSLGTCVNSIRQSIDEDKQNDYLISKIKKRMDRDCDGKIILSEFVPVYDKLTLGQKKIPGNLNQDYFVTFSIGDVKTIDVGYGRGSYNLKFSRDTANKIFESTPEPAYCKIDL